MSSLREGVQNSPRPGLSDLVKRGIELYKGPELKRREKAEILSGAFLGLLAPIFVTRYLAFGLGYEENLSLEAAKWGASIVAAPGYLFTIPAGILLGTWSAQSMKEKREREERERYKKKTFARFFGD